MSKSKPVEKENLTSKSKKEVTNKELLKTKELEAFSVRILELTYEESLVKLDSILNQLQNDH